MLALITPKNTVTISIIATVLCALGSTETTGGAAQSKGFRSGFGNPKPTDDLEQHRVAEKGALLPVCGCGRAQSGPARDNSVVAERVGGGENQAASVHMIVSSMAGTIEGAGTPSSSV